MSWSATPREDANITTTIFHFYTCCICPCISLQLLLQIAYQLIVLRPSTGVSCILTMAFKGLISLPFTQGARSYRLAGSGEKYEGLRDSISETGSEEQLLSGNSEEYARRREDIVIRFKRSFLVYTGLALIVLILVAVIATVTQRVRGTPKDARFPTYPMPDCKYLCICVVYFLFLTQA